MEILGTAEQGRCLLEYPLLKKISMKSLVVPKNVCVEESLESSII